MSASYSVVLPKLCLLCLGPMISLKLTIQRSRRTLRANARTTFGLKFRNELAVTRDTKYSVTAFTSGVAAMGLLVLLGLEFKDVDWVKWFGLVLWTAGVFGLLAYGYGRGLKKAKPMSIFLIALGLHLSAMIVYLRSAADFPNSLFLFLGPLEGALVVVAMTLLTDIDFRLPGRGRERREKWPPPGWREGRKTVKKHHGHE